VRGRGEAQTGGGGKMRENGWLRRGGFKGTLRFSERDVRRFWEFLVIIIIIKLILLKIRVTI
jgi:hypothetical protein